MRFYTENKHGHVEVYNEKGEFLFSADDMYEAQREIELLLAA